MSSLDQPDAIKAFLNQIIDYAGLFPPAELSLENTFNNYLKDSTSNNSWMLSKLIIPENLLNNLANLCNKQSLKNPLELSVICSSVTEFFRHHKKTTNHYNVASLEHKLPQNVALSDYLSAATNVSCENAVSIFFEVPLDCTSFTDQTAALVDMLSYNTYKQSGYKLRCGTTNPDTTPSSEQLAESIWLCSQANVPIKFTAGLHHPLRRHHANFGGYMHGFFNVYFAALTAYYHKCSKTELLKIIKEEHELPCIAAEQISWLGYSLKSYQIAKLRTESVLTFGSCSFTEPIDDLKNLGWL